MHLRALAAFGVALIACACTAPLLPSPTPAGLATPTPTPDPGARRLGSPIPDPLMGDLVGHWLALECGVGIVVTGSGEVYEVFPPDGWTVERDPPRWIDRAGNVRVRNKQPIAVNLDPNSHPGSFCMLAEPVQATEVVYPFGPPASVRAPGATLEPAATWGPLAVIDEPATNGEFAGIGGHVEIRDGCVTVGGITPIWRNSQVRWDEARQLIVFEDWRTGTIYEFGEGNYVTLGGGEWHPNARPVWLAHPAAACPRDWFAVHSMSPQD